MPYGRSDNAMCTFYTFPDSPGKEVLDQEALDQVSRELLGIENNALAVPETAAGSDGGAK